MRGPCPRRSFLAKRRHCPLPVGQPLRRGILARCCALALSCFGRQWAALRAHQTASVGKPSWTRPEVVLSGHTVLGYCRQRNIRAVRRPIVRVLHLAVLMGVETAPQIGSSAAAFQSFCGQLENKRVQTPRDTCAEFGEACVAGSGRFRGNVG